MVGNGDVNLMCFVVIAMRSRLFPAAGLGVSANGDAGRNRPRMQVTHPHLAVTRMRNPRVRGHHPIVRRGHDLHAPVSPTDHRRGAERPSVTVIEYADFESTACRAAEPAVRAILAAHPKSVQLVFRHYPLEPVHPMALMAAEASEAAAAQGKFWEMHDELMRREAPLERTALVFAAQELGLDMALFRAALNDEIYRQRIREQQDGAVRSHLRESPGFFVNGKVCDVSDGMHELADMVDAMS